VRAARLHLATPVSPEGVTRRRHIKIVGREVTRLNDEVLDLTVAGDRHRGAAVRAPLPACTAGTGPRRCARTRPSRTARPGRAGEHRAGAL